MSCVVHLVLVFGVCLLLKRTSNSTQGTVQRQDSLPTCVWFSQIPMFIKWRPFVIWGVAYSPLSHQSLPLWPHNGDCWINVDRFRCWTEFVKEGRATEAYGVTLQTTLRSTVETLPVKRNAQRICGIMVDLWIVAFGELCTKAKQTFDHCMMPTKISQSCAQSLYAQLCSVAPYFALYASLCCAPFSSYSLLTFLLCYGNSCPIVRYC